MHHATIAGDSAVGADLLEILAGRSSSYRMFSRLFLKPLTQEDVESLAAMNLESLADVLGPGELAAGFNDMGRGLHRRHTGTTRLLATDFTMCFDGLATLHECTAVPYASVFIGEKTKEKAELFQAPRQADRRAYAREGIAIDADLHLPDDHLSFELSFLADLSGKMEEAYRAGAIEEVVRLIEVSQQFRTGHILSWYDEFSDLASRIVETRFYRGVLRATGGYLRADGDTLEELRSLLAPAVVADGDSTDAAGEGAVALKAS